MSALSGLEQALWDLKGRVLGLPVWQMLGGKVRDKVRSYAWIGGDRPHEIAEAAEVRRNQGFTAVKMNATAELDWIGTPKLFDEVIKRVEAAQAQGMDVGLDFHGRVHRPMAKQLAKVLEPLGLLFIEEPLLSENPEGLAQIAAHDRRPRSRLASGCTAAGSSSRSSSRGAVDIIQPDLSHAGGILEVRKIAAMAEAYDVAVAPHCPLGPLALGACLQIAACTPNHAIQEISLGIHYNTGGHDLLNFCVNKEALTPVDGYLPVPEGPGLGVEIDEAAVREADKDRHRWRNPMFRQPQGRQLRRSGEPLAAALVALEAFERLQAGLAAPLRLARGRAEAADFLGVGRAALRAFGGRRWARAERFRRP